MKQGKSPELDRDTNILYIMTDQQRYDSLGCVTESICKTPFLDKLASEGVRFGQAYSVCALCSPARSSMLTGLYPRNHGMIFNNSQWSVLSQPRGTDLPDDVRLISQYLVEAGYSCGYSGKWHCGRLKVPSTYGFVGMDVPDYGNLYRTKEYGDYLAARGLEPPKLTPLNFREIGTWSGPPEACEPHFVAEFAIDLTEKFNKQLEEAGKPFMMFVSFWGPHWPYAVPEPYASMYSPADVELWPNFSDDLKNKPLVQRLFRRTWGRSSKDFWLKAIAKYWGFCTFIDAEIGRLLSALKDMDREKDTVVLFSTDHGDITGSHGGLFDKGPFMYEETYHIPMIAKLPRGTTAAGGVCEKLVSNMDLAASVLDIAGVPLPNNIDGRSLLPLLCDPNADWREDLMCEFHGHRFPYSQRMLRWDRYKYVFNASDLDELYDLETDPYEMVNRIDDRGIINVASECRKRLVDRMRGTGDPLQHAARLMLHS